VSRSVEEELTNSIFMWTLYEEWHVKCLSLCRELNMMRIFLSDLPEPYREGAPVFEDAADVMHRLNDFLLRQAAAMKNAIKGCATNPGEQDSGEKEEKE
jgi:hypothetical protein